MENPHNISEKITENTFQKTLIDSMPIQNSDLTPLFRNFEMTHNIARENIRTNDIINYLDETIFSNMHYDAINYLLTYQSDAELSNNDNWVNKLPSRGIKFLPGQKELFIQAVDERSEYGDYSEVYMALDENNFHILDTHRALRRALLINQTLTDTNDLYYKNKTISELIDQGTGNCNTFSVMAREILMHANIRYNLGLKDISIIHNTDIGHTYLEITDRYSKKFIYDPLKAIYIK